MISIGFLASVIQSDGSDMPHGSGKLCKTFKVERLEF